MNKPALIFCVAALVTMRRDWRVIHIVPRRPRP